MKKPISILGAGWLGLPLANSLLSQNAAIKLATRSQERLSILQDKTKAELFALDIESLANQDASFFASETLILNITSKNIEAYQNLIQLIEKSSVKQVLFVSSTSVYKNVNREVTESSGDELHVNPLYQIELLFRNNQSFKTTVIRFAGLVGYGRHPGQWFKSKTVSQPQAPVNLIHRDDCLGIIHSIIEQEEWGEVYNACSTTHPTKRQFYTFARNLLGLEPPDFSSKETLSYKQVSNKKVRTKLTYNFVYPDLLLCDSF